MYLFRVTTDLDALVNEHFYKVFRLLLFRLNHGGQHKQYFLAQKHKLPWNWPTMDNCAPYYSKPCCGYVNGSKLPPDERLKPTEWMTVPWVPLKEGQIHFSWLWLRLVPWAITRPVQERARVPSPQQLMLLTETSGSICVLMNPCIFHEGFIVYPCSVEVSSS